jgi:hypothetical protein
MYKTVRFFTDMQDGNHAYHEGDIYPRDGLTVSEERLAELASNKNRRKTPLIAKVEEKKDVDADMPGVEELVRPKSTETPRKNNNRRRKNTKPRVSDADKE